MVHGRLSMALSLRQNVSKAAKEHDAALQTELAAAVSTGRVQALGIEDPAMRPDQGNQLDKFQRKFAELESREQNVTDFHLKQMRAAEADWAKSTRNWQLEAQAAYAQLSYYRDQYLLLRNASIQFKTLQNAQLDAARSAREWKARAIRYRRMVHDQLSVLESIAEEPNTIAATTGAPAATTGKLLVHRGTIDLTPLLNATSNSTLDVSDLRYFTVIDTANAHYAWKSCSNCGRLLFFARRSARGMPGTLHTLRSMSIWLYTHQHRAPSLEPVVPWPVVEDYAFASNFDVLLTHGVLHAVGGHHLLWDETHGHSQFGQLDGHRLKPRDGIHLINATRLRQVETRRWQPWEQRLPAQKRRAGRSDLRAMSIIVDGRHAGCRENFVKYAPLCYFDSKLSLVRFQGRFLLYVRANTVVAGGGRFVQVAQSLVDNPVGPYGRFQMLDIGGYQGRPQMKQGNIYTAVVRGHPLDNGVLLGLFSVNLGIRGRTGPRSNGEGFVALSLSCDGRRWSPFTRLLKSVSDRARNFDQPVAGLLLRDGEVHFFVQRDVPMISPSAPSRSRLERYSFVTSQLMNITSAVKASDICSSAVGSAVANIEPEPRQPVSPQITQRDSLKDPPCCFTNKTKQVEQGRRGRCVFMAGNGRCEDPSFARNLCPVACGACMLCAGHPQLEFYIRLYRGDGGFCSKQKEALSANPLCRQNA